MHSINPRVTLAIVQNPRPDISTNEHETTLFPPVREPRIVLIWLMRLRWLAIVGQLTATLVAHALRLRAPLTPVMVVVGITVLSNVILWKWSQTRSVPTWVIFVVLLLDMTLLTGLLICTGGPENPFSTLYLVHVAMAVTMLGGGWTWLIVIAGVAGYSSLFVITPIRLTDGELSPAIRTLGLIANLTLIGSLVAYFSGRVSRSLQAREREIRELRERNERHEKLSTLTTLAAGAAHELGTPLATIAVVAKELELAIAKLPASPDLVEDARLIRQECDRCRFILDRMRVDVATDPSNVTTPLSDLLERLRQHLREDEKSRLEILGPVGGDSIACPCPAIEQSLTVLIRNAIDASPLDAKVRLIIRRLRSTIAFDVVDQGHGMDAEVLKRAGDPFFTTKEPGRGMGLGLFLVRLVAENFRGNFRMTSEPGKGTTSTLELPLA
ncbi:MAG: ATPase [Phycisphaerae bacterium]|nr:MAG: ATPase [Phycisphaerae bacterium]